MAEPNEPSFKGFGQPAEPVKAPPKKRRRQPRLADDEYKARRRYEEAEKAGQPAFEVFVRESGQTEWKPAGAIASPPNMIARAIYDSEEKLKQSAVRQYAALRKATQPLEYGYRRKEFEDDPIQLAERPKETLLNQFRSFLGRKFGQDKKK